VEIGQKLEILTKTVGMKFQTNTIANLASQDLLLPQCKQQQFFLSTIEYD